MPQNKVIDRIDVQDTFEELKQTQFLIDSIMMIFRETNDDQSDRVYYLLSIYQEKMTDILPRLDAIISCKN
jgi:hypothetical protein